MTSIEQQHASEKKLQGSRCDRCKHISFPAMSVCPTCGPAYSKEVKPAELPSTGTVLTWTKLQVAPKGFPSPLVHCVVDLGEIRIVGTVRDVPEIQIGIKMMTAEDPSGRFPFVLTRPLG